MDDQYRHPYLDADVYIAWIKGESRHGRPCKPIVDHILRHAEAGTFRIGISTLMLAEVHKTRAGPTLSRAEDDTLLAFFEHDYFDFVDVDRNIGEDANRLCRRYGLRPNDAIHLASALRLGCDVLLTWDERFLSVQHPNIRIEEPEMRGQLSLPPLTNGADST